MEEYIRQVKRLSITLCSVLMGSVILWVLTSYSTWVAGFALGLFIGLFNTLLTGIKVHRFSESIALGGRRAGLGMATRFSMAILGALIATRFPEHVSVVGLIVGILATQVFAAGDAIYFQKKNQHTSQIGERGE